MLKRVDAELYDLAMLNLETHAYDFIRSFPKEVTDLDAAAMLYDGDDAFALAAFQFGHTDTSSPCFFNEIGELTCVSGGELMGLPPYVGAVVNTNFYYAAGLLNGEPLYMVDAINSDHPTFFNTSFIIPNIANVQIDDLTNFAQDNCPGPNGCVIGDDAPHYLVALSRSAAAVLVIALDDNLIPDRYMIVRGVLVTHRDGSTKVSPDARLGNMGACWSFVTNVTEGVRVACSSDGGAGIFELGLPLDLSTCGHAWQPINTQDLSGNSRVEAKFVGHPSVCDLYAKPTKPKANFFLKSEPTNFNNDGLVCRFVTLISAAPTPVPTITPVPSATPTPAPSALPTAIPLQCLADPNFDYCSFPCSSSS